LRLAEVNEASSIIQSAAHEDANIIFGAVLDEKMKDEVKITVIATGFKHFERKENSVSAAAAAIQQTRTATTYFTPGERARPAEPEAPGTSAPVRRTAEPASSVRDETSVDDIKNVKASFGDDDLDVPAFIRKRQDKQ
jgi:cell division protein FtsZ